MAITSVPANKVLPPLTRQTALARNLLTADVLQVAELPEQLTPGQALLCWAWLQLWTMSQHKQLPEQSIWYILKVIRDEVLRRGDLAGDAFLNAKTVDESAILVLADTEQFTCSGLTGWFDYVLGKPAVGASSPVCVTSINLTNLLYLKLLDLHNQAAAEE